MRMRSSWLASAVWVPLCCVALLAPAGVATGLATPAELSELDETDREALETIANQSDALRDAVLKASVQVDVLVETQRIQEQSSAAFQQRIATLDKQQQQQIWELVREPGLLEELGTDKPPSSEDLDAIAKRHREALAPAVREFGSKHQRLLSECAGIHRKARERFDVLLEDLPGDTQQAFRDLVDQPELLSVLARRVRLAVRLGDSYRRDPEGTRLHLAELGKEVAQRNADAKQEWVESIEDEPEASADLEKSARAYAEENGYEYDELTRPEVRTTVQVVVHPYPFWFGYPIWYSDLYLYPYGYWYPYPPYFGYYHDHGRYVYFGLPSIPFLHWFFVGHHHRHYSYLSHWFDRHHQHHPYARDYFHVTVNNWVTYRDRYDRDRGDWSTTSGERPSGRDRYGRYTDRDRGFFFNRHRRDERSGGDVDRRLPPGERGPEIGGRSGRIERPSGRSRDGRGDRQLSPPAPQPDASAAPGVRSGRPDRDARPSGRGRNGTQAREVPGAVVEEPRADHREVRRAAPVPGNERFDRPARRQDRPVFERPDSGARQQRERVGPSSPRRGEGSARRGEVPRARQDPVPRFETPPQQGGGAPDSGSRHDGGDRGSRDHGGFSNGGDRGVHGGGGGGSRHDGGGGGRPEGRGRGR